jgi:hypothetical protein
MASATNDNSDTTEEDRDSKTRSNNGILTFETTDGMKKIGIERFVLNRRDFEFTFTGGRKCCILFLSKEASIAQCVKIIRHQLWQRIKNIINDKEDFEPAIADIEDQLITHRDEIFRVSTSGGTTTGEDAQDPQKVRFIEDVSKLRNEFEKSGVAYEHWQSIVADKYETLRRITIKHYPEAWPFLEFCLAVKSILNVKDFTLPFMGVLLAAPASMKTMIIQLFRKYPGSFYTDSSTPNSLVSHSSTLPEEKLQQVDMLPKLKDKLVLTPELAPIFTSKDDDLQKVLGMITRILDGHGFESDSGAQGHRRYGDTMLVWLGAGVEIPPKVWRLLGTLGHKIYFIRPPLSKKTPEDLKRIAKNNNFSINNKEIEDALLDYLKTFDACPEADKKTTRTTKEDGVVKLKWNEDAGEEQDRAIGHISEVAHLLAPLRGTVYVSESKPTSHRYNNYKQHQHHNQQQESSTQKQQDNSSNNSPQIEGQDYDTDFPIIEDPSRAVILLRNLAIGHAVSQGRNSINLKDVPITIKVALSTAVVRRVKVLDLLLRRGEGELTTSQITKELRVSQPVARRTMREFHALGIADLSAIGEYGNSELKITLRSEYNWFKGKEFEQLRENFTPGDSSDSSSNGETDTDEPSSTNGLWSCDLNSGHMQKVKSTPETHEKIFDCSRQYDDSQKDKKNSVSISKNPVTDENNDTCLYGVNSLQHVTQSHSHMQSSLLPEEDEGFLDDAAKAEEGPIFQEILTIIEEANGFQVAVNSAIQTAYNRSEQVRNYFGDKLTQRENKRVKNLCLKVIRHSNIEVVKHRPQLVVKWSAAEQTRQDANAVNEGAAAA